MSSTSAQSGGIHCVNKLPAWMNRNDSHDNGDRSRKDSKPNRARMFVVYGSILNTSGKVVPRPMPLHIDNNSPSTVICFGSSDANEIAFSVHCNSCAVMNTANTLLIEACTLLRISHPTLGNSIPPSRHVKRHKSIKKKMKT